MSTYVLRFSANCHFCAWMERNKLIVLFSFGFGFFFIYDTRTHLYIRITPESIGFCIIYIVKANGFPAHVYGVLFSDLI